MTEIYYDTSSLDDFLQVLHEKTQELRYELDGPASYDSDFKRELRERGEWEEEVARWEKSRETDEEERLLLEAKLDAYNDVYSLAESVRKRGHKEAVRNRNEWNQQRRMRGEDVTTYLTPEEARVLRPRR